MGSVETLDVLIVGAGPVGLALALDLGRRGVRSTIVERDSGTGAQLHAKASVIDERTMEFCRLLGVRDDVANAGYPADLPADTVFCTTLNGHYIGRLEMASARDREVPVQAAEMMRRCPQIWFDPVLARAVVRQGMADVRYGIELVGSCDQDELGVTCRLRHVNDGTLEVVRARYVVACDGAGSAVRKALGIPFEGKDLGYAISAIVRVQLADYYQSFGAAERFMFVGPDGVWANFTTIDGQALWRFSVIGGREKIDLATLDLHALLRKAVGQEAEYEIVKVVQWRRSQFTAATYRQGRIFLAGDAAHTMSPTGGHGLNTGIADAMDLSWMLQGLLAGWGGPGLADAYTIERRPIAICNGAGSTRNFSIWIGNSGRDKVLDDGPDADQQRHVLGENMAANMRQEFQSLGLALGYNYSESPLIVPDGSAAPANEPDMYIQTARPGHRAPHYWLADGRSTIDLFGSNGFVLLRLGPEAEGDQGLENAARKVHLPLKTVDLANHEVASLYERRLVLVRADGMVAWRGDALPDDVEALADVVRGASSSE